MKRLFGFLLVAIMVIMPNASSFAQDAPAITLSVPAFWRDLMSENLLAAFEEQFGVDVYLAYSDATFNMSSPAGGLETYQEDMEAYASTADVIYVDSTLLNPINTTGGYFLNLAPLVSSDAALNPGDFVSGAWNSFQWDNGFWAIPVSLDFVIVSYKPTAFDAAGLTYPTASWTTTDFANAARRLAVYDADGNVTTPGMMTGFNDYTPLLVRSLLGKGFYDSGTLPNNPRLADSALADILTTLRELEVEGVLVSGFTENFQDIPLRIGQSREFGFGPGPGNDNQNEDAGVLLPGNLAGLDVQGFAISSGTQFPELAYQLAVYLSTVPEVANNFLSVTPARNNISVSSMIEGEGFQFARANSPLVEAILPDALANALPSSELRYTDYLLLALESMRNNGTDALTALQDAEAQAFADLQTVQVNPVSLLVAPPPAPVELAEGEIALNFGYSSSIGTGGRVVMIGGGMPNQERWDQVIQEFVASDSQVGAVNLTPSNDGLEALTEQYDCFTLPYNAIPGSDLSGVLSLDPYLDTDVSFDRNAVIGNTLAQLQLNNQTWAMPLAIQPEALRYDSNLFAQAGAVAPENGWSTDQFIDALRLLKNVTGETSPFISQTPGGSHLLMLMAAFGGLPIDYRTNPPTLNFSDQTTVDAIRQVLDLAKQGYIEYNELSAQEFVVINDGEGDPVAITTDSLSPFSFQARVGGEDTTRLTTYPTGTYGVVSYQITTGYISTNAQNADACYRWLSTLARHPELFSGMPAQSSILDDPAVTAAQGAGTVEAFRQFDALIRDPNTVVMPAGFRTGGSPADFLQEYWLLRAFDRYVLQDADLAAELADAQIITQAFQQCAANLPPVENGNPGAAFEGILTCAQTADPTFEAG